ncbi:hypothetical protein QBC37DRAFT_328333 [Rhypophila decipiens]|uniref:Uncharacterized protein n=1 Tax=Rhypophila decipiens TaxID=261697 RepID=A0AAN7B1X6_9PEZI|nr:hypothetical protein QBC37DRAFT_328333 [Rhypophila decipiens]
MATLMPKTKIRGTQSFPIVSSSTKGPSGSYDITYVLVHGLEGLVGPDGVSYERKLRFLLKLIVKDARRDGRDNHIAHMFPFNLQTLLEKGGNEFERLRKKLYRKIEMQPWSTWTNVVQSVQTGRAVNDGSTEPVTSSPAPPPIVFLCHGVGTWIVKDMLSTDLGNFVAVNTLSVIPLDTLQFSSEQPAGQRYIASAKKQMETFGVAEPPETNIKELSKLMERADMGFSKLQELIQELPGLHQLPKWIADPVSLWTLDSLQLEPIDLATRKGRTRRKLSAKLGRISRRKMDLPNQPALQERLEGVLSKLDEVRYTPGPGLDRLAIQEIPTDWETPVARPDGTESALTDREAMEASRRATETAPLPPSLKNIHDLPGSSPQTFKGSPADISPWPSSDTYTSAPNLDIIKNAVKDQTQILDSGDYKQYARVIESLQRLKEQYERHTLNGKVVELLSELDRLLAHWLIAGRGDYWNAAVELLKAPNLRPISLSKRNDAVIVNSAHTLGDLALIFASLGFFTKASTVIRLSLKSVDHKLDEIKNYEQQQDTDRILDEARYSKAQVVKSELMIKRDSLAEIAAKVHLSAGDYRRALKLAEEAWLGFCDHLGTKDLSTLKAQVLVAELLALNSRAKEAEISCYQAWQALSAKCGSRHPQTLNALRTLVFIFRLEYRLVEAIDTGRSLCQLTEEATAGTHPFTIAAQAEFARALMMDGQYKAAELEYNKLLEDSRKLYSFCSDHPETLLYESELARVYLRLGRLENAERLALKVLKGQHHAYQFERSTASERKLDITLEKPPQNDSNYHSVDILLYTVMNDLRFEMALNVSLEEMFKPVQDADGPERHRTSSEQITALDLFISHLSSTGPAGITQARLKDRQTQDDMFAIRREIATGPGMSNARLAEKLRALLSRLRVHPWLLFTIQTLVEIHIQKGPGDSKSALAGEMANMALQWCTRTMGEVNHSTLKAKYKLALVTRNTGDNDKARQLLLELYQHQALYFEDNHPEMLEVKRELIMTSVAADRWQDPDSVLTSSPNPSDDEFDDIGRDSNGPTPPGTPGTVTTEENGLGDATATREDTAKPMTREDWADVERQSVMIALALQGRMGPNHPETLRTYLWILAVQLMVGNLVEGSQTSRLIVERSCHKEVLYQRPIKALKALEHAAALCLEANLVADALDIYSEIVNCGKRMLVDQPQPGPGSSTKSTAPLAEDERGKISDFVFKCQVKINDVMYTGAEGALERMRELYDLYSKSARGARDGDILIMNGLRFASRARLLAEDYAFLRSEALRRYRLLAESLGQHFEDGEMSPKKRKAGKDILDNAFKVLQSTLVEKQDALEDSKRLHAKLQKKLQNEEWRQKRIAMDADDWVDWRGFSNHINGTPGGPEDDARGATDKIVSEVVEQCLEFAHGLERAQPGGE